jgi:RimJ/RimL family protein N-acetyltransferase
MGWAVVPIAEEHIEGFCAAVDSVAREREYLAFLEGPPLEMSCAFVLRNLHEGRPHFVAVEGGRVVGWCDISSLDRPVLAHSGVLGMGVVASHRGQGIGEALIRAALERARAVGLTRVELTVREGNSRARALYEEVGFAIEGVKRNAVKVGERYENHVCMAILFGGQA